MKTLIVEDDFTCRKILQAFLLPFGECHVAVNGREALEAFVAAHAERKPYDLVCLDLMMPEVDGHRTLDLLREHERRIMSSGFKDARIVVTTALSDPKSVLGAFRNQCDAYLVKPIQRPKLVAKIKELGLIPEAAA